MKISISNHLYRRFEHRLLPFALCSSIFLSMSASANDWSTDYGIYATLGWEDNFRLTEVDPVATTSTNVSVSGELRGSSEVSNIAIGASAGGTNYSEQSIEDSQLYSLFLRTKRRFGERWLSALNMSFNLEPTTVSEELDTGVLLDGEKTLVSILPSINYQINERNSINSDLKFSDVSYDTVLLTGYTDTSIAAGWVYSLSEVSSFSLNGQASIYEPEDDETTTVTGVNLGYDIDISEATNYSLRLGYADIDAPGGKNRDQDSSFEIQYNLDERNGFLLLASNGYEPSGSGGVRYTSRLNLRWDHALAERLKFDLAVEGVKTKSRDYFAIVVGGSRQITRELRLAANYRYRQQQSDFNDANSNSVYISLSYSPVSSWSHEI